MNPGTLDLHPFGAQIIIFEGFTTFTNVGKLSTDFGEVGERSTFSHRPESIYWNIFDCFYVPSNASVFGQQMCIFTLNAPFVSLLSAAPYNFLSA